MRKMIMSLALLGGVAAGGASVQAAPVVTAPALHSAPTVQTVQWAAPGWRRHEYWRERRAERWQRHEALRHQREWRARRAYGYRY